MDNIDIMWGNDRLFCIVKTPDHKIQYALSLVQKAMAGNLAFCYKCVIKIPLYDGMKVRRKILELKNERIQFTTEKDRVYRISAGLKTLRKIEKEYYQFDEKTYKKLLSNYNKLHKALVLLHREGEIESFWCSPRGMLKVQFFTERDHIEIQEIEQGWTWNYDYDRIRKKDQRPESPAGFPESNLRTTTHMNNTGYIETTSIRSQRVTKGSGEYDPYGDIYRKDIVFDEHKTKIGKHNDVINHKQEEK